MNAMEALARVDIRARTHRAATDVTVSLLDNTRHTIEAKIDNILAGISNFITYWRSNNRLFV